MENQKLEIISTKVLKTSNIDFESRKIIFTITYSKAKNHKAYIKMPNTSGPSNSEWFRNGANPSNE